MAAQLCMVAMLTALLSHAACAAYVEDSLDGNVLLQVHGLGDNFQEDKFKQVLGGSKNVESKQVVTSSMPQKPIPLWVWEERGTEPSTLQQACESSWRLHAPARFFDIRFVNRQTISRWLPGLPTGFWRLPTEEAKSDVARAGLLAKHGGVYMDYDILLRSELIDTVERLSAADVVSFAANGQSCGKDALSLSFMVARNRSVVASRWYNKAVKLLTTPCTKSSDKVCCSDHSGELKQCKVAPSALGERLARKAMTEVLMEQPNLKIECFDHGKSEGMEDCKWACLSQKTTDTSLKLVRRPGMAYKLFADTARQSMSRVNSTQLRQGKQLASELIRQSTKHKTELYLIHIPRTGGTTIEFLSRTEPFPEDRWGVLSPEVRGLHPIGKSGRKCYGQHVPPNFLPIWGNKTTFCVVRNPYDRMVSEFGYSQGLRGNLNCSVEAMNDELLRTLTSVMKGDAEQHDCHLLPQAAYVWGWDEVAKTVDTSVQNCEKVLRFERFTHDFDHLMIEAGYPHRMEDTIGKLTSSVECEKLTVADLSDEVREAIKQVYAKDFQLLFQRNKLGDPERM